MLTTSSNDHSRNNSKLFFSASSSLPERNGEQLLLTGESQLQYSSIEGEQLQTLMERLKFSDRVNIALLCLDLVCHGICYALIASFYPIKAEERGLKTADVGIVMAALPLATILFGTSVNYVMPKYGAKKILLFSFFTEAVSLIIFAFVTDIESKSGFYAVSMLCRVGQGAALVAAQVTSFSFATRDYNAIMSTLMGLLEMSFSSGISLGPAIGGFLYDQIGFKAPFILLTCLNAAMFVAIFTCLHPKQDDLLNEMEDSPTAEIGDNELSIRSMLTIPALLLPLGICVNSFMNVTLFDLSLALFFSETFKFSSTIIGLIFLGTVTVYAIVCPLIGIINDKKGYHGLTMVIGCFISALAFLFIGPSPFLGIRHHVWLTIISMMFLFIGSAQMYVPILGMCYNILSRNNFLKNQQTNCFISSAFVLSGNIGNLLGPFVGGELMGAFGFEWCCFIYGVITLLVGICQGVYLLQIYMKTTG